MFGEQNEDDDDADANDEEFGYGGDVGGGSKMLKYCLCVSACACWFVEVSLPITVPILSREIV